mmetsp:Transcript_16851/g.51812  ORF Transcript_16851/g.51812 Transcript_16851/m.51812 type:complete len:657 (+) Transcript_16851:161-2131(+)
MEALYYTDTTLSLRVRPTPRSSQAESLGVLDGEQEPVAELLDGAVLGQEEVVEAGVARGQALRVAAVLGHDDVEAAEAADGRAVRARHELEERPLLLLAEAVHDDPEVADDGAALGVAVGVLRRLLEVLEVERRVAADEELELFAAEEVQDAAAADLAEAALEGFKARLDAVDEPPVHEGVDVGLALFGAHDGVFAVRPQRHGAHAALAEHEGFVGEAPGLLHGVRIGRVHGEVGLEALGHLRLDGLEVGERELNLGLAEQLLVGEERERQVQDDAIVDGHAEEDADELKGGRLLHGVRVEEEQRVVAVLAEDVVVPVQQLAHDDLEELLLHAALVDAELAPELHAQSLLEEEVGHEHDLVQRVAHDRVPAHVQVHVRVHARRLARAGEDRGLDGDVHLLPELVPHLELGVEVQDLRLDGGLQHEGEREHGAHLREALEHGLQRRRLLPLAVAVALGLGGLHPLPGGLALGHGLVLRLSPVRLLRDVPHPVAVLPLEVPRRRHDLPVDGVVVEGLPGQELARAGHESRLVRLVHVLVRVHGRGAAPRHVEHVVAQRARSAPAVGREEQAQRAHGVHHLLHGLDRRRRQQAAERPVGALLGEQPGEREVLLQCERQRLEEARVQRAEPARDGGGLERRQRAQAGAEALEHVVVGGVR